jgi:hypothetical protein
MFKRCLSLPILTHEHCAVLAEHFNFRKARNCHFTLVKPAEMLASRCRTANVGCVTYVSQAEPSTAKGRHGLQGVRHVPILTSSKRRCGAAQKIGSQI